MKYYEKPDLEKIMYKSEDVITDSTQISTQPTTEEWNPEIHKP